MLSPTGRCHTFDAAADGFVRGEGCGIVVLKRLADALADGDPVWAVIRGSAVNHDGRSSGLTVPNGTAQREVIARALELGGVPPDAVVDLLAGFTALEVTLNSPAAEAQAMADPKVRRLMCMVCCLLSVVAMVWVRGNAAGALRGAASFRQGRRWCAP